MLIKRGKKRPFLFVIQRSILNVYFNTEKCKENKIIKLLRKELKCKFYPNFCYNY